MKTNFLKPVICTLIACMVLSTADCSSFEVKERNRNIGKIIYNELISENAAEIPVYQSQNSDIACQKLITLNYLPDKNVNTYTVEVDNFHYNLYPEYHVIKRSDLPKDANGIDKDWIGVVITYGFTSKCG